MPDIIIEKQNKNSDPTKEQQEQIANHISKRWTSWDNARLNTLVINDEVGKQLTYSDKKDLEGKLPDVLEICDSIIAQIDNSCFKSADSMFCVSIPNKEDKDNKAAIQKASIVNAINKAKIMDIYSDAAEIFVKKGAWILFHSWEERYKPKRVQTALIDEFGNPQFDYKVQDVLVNDGPKVIACEPKDVVFDSSKIKKMNTPECPFIYRSWATFEEITENKAYKPFLDKEKIKELQDLVEDKDPETQYSNKSSSKDDNGDTRGDQIELLEYWGDIKVKEQTFRKNMRITVAAGKYIIRYEENPYVEWPWVYFAYFIDEKTKHALSMLTSAVTWNNKASNILDAMLEALKYALNPMYWVKKGVKILNKGKKTEPGTLLEWEDPQGSNQAPQEVNSYKNIPINWDFLSFFEKKQEQATGCSKYASGDANGIARTAQESRQILSGQNNRFGRLILKLSNKGIIPSVEKIAALLANFNFDAELLKYTLPGGGEDYTTITPDIRQGEYDYAVGNSQVLVEQKAILNEIMPFVDGLLKMGWKPNPSEFWLWGSQSFEIQNPKKFEMTDPLQEVLSQLPPEEQDPIKQQLADLVTNQIQMNSMGVNNGQPNNTGNTGIPTGQPNPADIQPPIQ